MPISRVQTRVMLKKSFSEILTIGPSDALSRLSILLRCFPCVGIRCFREVFHQSTFYKQTHMEKTVMLCSGEGTIDMLQEWILFREDVQVMSFGAISKSSEHSVHAFLIRNTRTCSHDSSVNSQCYMLRHGETVKLCHVYRTVVIPGPLIGWSHNCSTTACSGLDSRLCW